MPLQDANPTPSFGGFGVKPITLTLAPVSWYGAGSLPSRERGFSLGVVDVFRGVEAE